MTVNQHQQAGQPLARAVRYALLAAALAPAYFLSANVMAQSVSAGPDRTVPDTDGLNGEVVTLDGSASIADPGASSVSYVWTNAQGVQIGSGQTASVRLPDGVNPVTLSMTEVFDNDSSSVSTTTATAIVNITVQAPIVPVANAGVSRAIADTDGKPGEAVTLDGSASSDPDGSIVSYEWSRDGARLGSGAVLNNVQLPDGVNEITLLVTDNVGNTASTVITITVGASTPPTPSSLVNEGLDPNQASVARNLDNLCERLSQLNPESQPLTEDQSDLLAHCSGIIGSSTEQQAKALEELGAQDINAIRTTALVFSRTQYQGVMDRLLALRSGDRGISVAGLTLSIGDRIVSAEQVAQSLRQLLGGGASADGADEPGGLLSDRLGIWMRGNYGIGKKGVSPADTGFRADQWGFTGGVDYRFGDSAVLGVSLGYGQADVDFKPIGQGNLDSAAWSGALYGSAYWGNFYLDGVFNYAGTDYDSKRRILYSEGGTEVDRTARGSTSGNAWSGGVSLGYDFYFGGFTVSPTLGYFYVDTNIDRFIERGAGGLNLAYDKQNYESATGNLGLRISYAWRTSWGVLIPHLRATYVREFEDATEVFGVRFASDPFADSGNPSPPIIVRSDEPDTSYFRFAAGASAQLPYGISGYFEYQRLEGLAFTSFQDFTVGLRIQHSF